MNLLAIPPTASSVGASGWLRCQAGRQMFGNDSPSVEGNVRAIVAQLRREFYDEQTPSAPGGVELVGLERAFDLGYRAGNNAAKRECIALLSQGSVVEGLRELAAAQPVQLPRHWLAEHEAERG